MSSFQFKLDLSEQMALHALETKNILGGFKSTDKSIYKKSPEKGPAVSHLLNFKM